MPKNAKEKKEELNTKKVAKSRKKSTIKNDKKSIGKSTSKNETKAVTKSPKKAVSKTTSKKSVSEADNKTTFQKVAEKVKVVAETLVKQATTKKSSSVSAKKATKKVATKSTVKKADSTKASAKKSTAKEETPKKVPSKKSATKKASSTSKASTEKVAPKKTADKKETAKKATAKKTTTKKSTSKKSSTKTTTTKKSTAKKNSSKKTSVKKVIEPIATTIEYYDLPFRYNQTVVKILAQTPNMLFIYWDISDTDRKAFEKKYGDNFFEITRPVLIIENKTMNYTFEIEINDFANSWYLPINDPNCDYHVELGRRFKYNSDSSSSDTQPYYINEYLYVISSNTIEAPNDHILFDQLGKSVFFRNVKTNFIEERSISSLSYLRNLGRIYSIYDLYKELYKDELISDGFGLNLPSSSSSPTFK